MVDIVLYGTLSSIDLSTYDDYYDKVNSDVEGEGTTKFLGAEPGHVLFRSASASPRVIYDEEGDPKSVVDVELRLTYRTRSWNEFYNETTGEWEEIWDSEDNPYYEEKLFAGLLT